TVSVRAIDTKKVSAFNAKTHEAPTDASRRPPITGPIAIPAYMLVDTRLFAQLMSSSESTGFGIAARDAVKNGSSASADPNARPINHSGVSTNAIATKNSADTPSHPIITVRRSKRAPVAH